MHLSQHVRAAILGIAALGLTAARPPASPGFYVIADGGSESGSVTSFVSSQLQAKGYRLARAPGEADMLVKVRYRVDTGRAYPGIAYNPRRSKFGSDEFTSSNYSPLSRMPVGAERTDYYQLGPHRNAAYNAQVEIQIVRRADNTRVFRGTASMHGAGDPSVAAASLVEKSLTEFPATR